MRVNLLDYTDFKVQLGNLDSFRKTLAARAEENRKIRDSNLDTMAMRESGPLLPDEVAVPQRVVNNTITRNITNYDRYLRQPIRLIILKNPKDPAKSYAQNEIYYTDKLKQPDWDSPFLRVGDSGELHGLGFMEVVYDDGEDFPIRFEFVKYEDIVYDKKAKNLQRQSMIARRLEWNADALEETLDPVFGFNPEVVEKIVGECKDVFKLFDIYKVWFKIKRVVYVAWASMNGEGFLKDPRPLNVTGIPESRYPIHEFRLILGEDDELNQAKGRAFLEKDNQEAVTQLWQSCINGSIRASKFYPTPENPVEDKDELAKLVFKHGTPVGIPMKIFQAAYPNPIMLSTAQAIQRNQLQDSGAVDYAVMAREDSNKTATEINAAGELQSQQIGMVMANYSRFFRNVHTNAWDWVRGLALQNKIPWYGAKVVVGNPGLPPMMENPKELLAPNFQVFAAGDYEFVRRKELQDLFARFGDVFKGTPVGRMLTYDLLTVLFPEAGGRYAEAYKQYNILNEQTTLLATGLLERVKELIAMDPMIAKAFPELQQTENAIAQLNSIYGNSQRVLGNVEGSPSNEEPSVGVNENAG